MSLGEKSEFIMTPEYTNDITNNNENIPKEAVLTYQIELKSIHYKSTEESLENLTYEEKLQWGKLLKQNGVEKFIKTIICCIFAIKSYFGSLII